MPLLLLLKLKRFWREGIIFGLILAMVAGILYVRNARYQRDEARAELEKVKVAYANPATANASATTRTEGPTVMREKIYRMPYSEYAKHNPDEAIRVRDDMNAQWMEIIDREFRTDGSDETVITSSSTTPDAGPLAAVGFRRQNRWLAGVQRHGDAYAGLAGYSFSNRLDVLAGYGDGGILGQVVIRF